MTQFKAGDIVILKRCNCGSGLSINDKYTVKINDVYELYLGDIDDCVKGYCICPESWEPSSISSEPLPKPIVKPEWLKKVEFQSKRGWLITKDTIVSPQGVRYSHKAFTELYNDYRSVVRKLLSLKKDKEL